MVCVTFAAVRVLQPLCLRLFTTSNELIIIRVTISRRTRSAGHVAHKGKKSNACEVLVEKLERMRPHVGRR
jgi:hypothetical protein